jgi:hypothetical protein
LGTILFESIPFDLPIGSWLAALDFSLRRWQDRSKLLSEQTTPAAKRSRRTRMALRAR